MGWDKVTALCPHGRETLPSPADIKKLVCEVATQKMIEDKATSEVCSLIEEKFPSIHLQPDCKTVAEAAWDKVTALCPHGRETLPNPADIEKLVCEVATQKMIEDKATSKVCSFMTKHVRDSRVCKLLVEAAWNRLEVHCPHVKNTFSHSDGNQNLIVV